jgi:hypothetical protein
MAFAMNAKTVDIKTADGTAPCQRHWEQILRLFAANLPTL